MQLKLCNTHQCVPEPADGMGEIFDHACCLNKQHTWHVHGSHKRVVHVCAGPDSTQLRTWHMLCRC